MSNDKAETKKVIALATILNDRTNEGKYMCCKALRKNEFDIDKAEKWLKETYWQRRTLA